MLEYAPVAARRAAALGCHREAADYPLASRYHDEGIRYCTDHDQDTWRLYMLASQARADFEQGHWSEATRTVETVLRDPRTPPISRLDGDPDAARVMMDDALDLAERLASQTWPWPTRELAFWFWRLGGPDRLPVGGLPKATAEQFRLQMDGAWEAAVAHKLRALGVRGLARGPRPSARANPANLTARKLEVLGLLVEGRSNRQSAWSPPPSPKPKAAPAAI